MDVMTSCRPCFHLSLLGLLALTSVGRGATEKLSFNRDLRPILTENCFACHGPDGTGMAALGAPNLADKVWLYGGSEAKIVESIVNGRMNQMPAWKEFLGEGKVHVLAAYVLNLNGGAAKK